MKKVLIINKNEFVGSGIHESLSTEYVVGGVSRSGEGQNTRKLNISDKYAVSNFFRGQSFDVIVFCPIISRHSDHEGVSEYIDRQVEQVKNVVDIAKDKQLKFIYISSKDVYGGDNPPYKIGSERAPVNHYGKSCLESEYIIQKELENYCIIRPGKIYGFTESHGYDCFTQSILEHKSSDRMLFDNEVVEYPTLIDDLVDLVKKIIKHNLTNNYNISSSHGVTNFGWAKTVCDIHDIDHRFLSSSEDFKEEDRPHDVKFDLDSITDLGLSVKSVKEGLEIARMQNLCTFRPIYIQDIKDDFGDKSSSSIRHTLGEALVERDNIDVDVVIPIPESGIYPASGYSNKAGVPLKFALSKQNLRHRTLYDNSIDRSEILEGSMQAIPSMFRNKKVILVDEAILSGTTVKSIVSKFDSAKEVHLRISSPPVVRPCPAGIYPEDIDLLIQKVGNLEGKDLHTIEKRLSKELKLDSVKFVPTEDYRDIVGKSEGICTYCFN